MYVEGQEKTNVESWVGVVKALKYKDFQLVTRPEPLEVDEGGGNATPSDHKEAKRAVGVEEVDSVKDFGRLMSNWGLWRWWRRGMGYERVD